MKKPRRTHILQRHAKQLDRPTASTPGQKDYERHQGNWAEVASRQPPRTHNPLPVAAVHALNQVQRRLLLNMAGGQGAPILELLPTEENALVGCAYALLTLGLLLDPGDGISRRNTQHVDIACQGHIEDRQDTVRICYTLLAACNSMNCALEVVRYRFDAIHNVPGHVCDVL